MGKSPIWSPSVSIILPVRNEAATISSCLEGLLAQDYPRISEIIVADGASNDETRSIIRSYASRDRRIRLIDNPARVTPQALNLAIAQSTGDIIARMDGHARPEADYISSGVQVLAETGAWCVGGVMLKSGGEPIQRAIARATSSPLAVGNALHNYAARPRSVETVFLGMWPRWVFDRVGMFDPELERNQDDELSYRIRATGGVIWLDPRMVVTYEPRDSIGRLFSQYRQYGMWKVRVFQKHPRAARWRHFAPAISLAFLTATGALAPLNMFSRVAFFGSLATYLAIVAAGAVRIARPGESSRLIALAVATVHLAYGLGFWQGIARFGLRHTGPTARTGLEEQGPQPSSSARERDAAIESTRNAYSSYQRSGYSRRWEKLVGGMRWGRDDRDQWLLAALGDRPVETLVDLGCGDGNVARLLAAAGVPPVRYVGVDIDRSRLAEARRMTGSEEFIHGSADRLPLADSSVDAVIAFLLLSSVVDLEFRSAIIAEAERVIRPRGKLIVYDIRYPSPRNPRVKPISERWIRQRLPGWESRSKTMSLLPPLARSAVFGNRAVYEAAVAIPVLRSHLGIILERPGV